VRVMQGRSERRHTTSVKSGRGLLKCADTVGIGSCAFCGGASHLLA
jgi:hypothetical protein